MDKSKDTSAIKEELERLREKLNKDVVKNIDQLVVVNNFFYNFI